MAQGLSLAPGGGMARGPEGSGDPRRAGMAQAVAGASGAGGAAPDQHKALPGAGTFGVGAFGAGPTLAELFAASPRDAGWTGFLLARLERGRPLLWVQERMAILEAGRVYPPGLPAGLADADLIHVEARDARDALWAMEEGLRCPTIGAVIGEIWGDPGSLDFTATRRLAVAAERHRVAAFLIRLGGRADLSGARFRWRVASAPSRPHPLDPRAPGMAAWDCELFRARGAAPGRWIVTDEPGEGRAAGGLDRVAAPADRALGQDQRRRA